MNACPHRATSLDTEIFITARTIYQKFYCRINLNEVTRIHKWSVQFGRSQIDHIYNNKSNIVTKTVLLSVEMTLLYVHWELSTMIHYFARMASVQSQCLNSNIRYSDVLRPGFHILLSLQYIIYWSICPGRLIKLLPIGDTSGIK